MNQPYFPLFIDLSDQTVFVSGGGKIALRRIRTLIHFGARIRVTAPDLCPELSLMEREGRIHVEHREYEPADLEGAVLVLAATDKREVNQRIFEDCRERGIPVNTADDRTCSDFYFPSVVMTDEVTVGISSGGEDPGQTKETRKKIERLLGKNGADSLYDP